MSVIRTWIYLVLHFSVLVSFCFAGQSDDQFLLASAKFRSLTSAEASNGLIAETSNGLISGKIDRSWPDVRQFLGVPYAHPPTDEFRWQDPVRPKSWKPFIRRATSKAPSCPQLLLLEAQSEDCLYLDVFTPTTPRIDENKPLPVLVWLHGGAWIIGSGSTVGVQNPSYIVQHKNVIVVRVQYRLGPLGFLATEDLEGNYGLKDQEFALKWTKENIRKFGGDPNQVTLWGQSAGAMSISFHLTADLSHGLFQQAILESNVLGINYRTRSEATILGEALAKKVGCNVRDLACLRKVPAAVISYLRPPIGMFNQKRKLGDILLWTPVIDGKIITQHPRKAILSNQVKNVPILSGFNRDEAGLALELIDDIAKLFTGGRDVLLRKGNYEAAMQYIFGNSSNEVLEAYPSSEVPDENLDSLGRAATDLLVACPKRQAALSLSKQQNVYFYSFEFQPRFIPVIQRCKSKEVCHGLELPYVFHSLQNWMIIPKFSREEHKISHALIDYFTSFASSTLDQGKFDKFMAHDMGKDKDSLSQLPAWAPITVEQQNYLKFTNDADVILTDQPWNRHCDMWDRLDYIF